MKLGTDSARQWPSATSSRSLAALITLDAEAVARLGLRPTGSSGMTTAALRDDPELRADVQAAVDDANAAVSRAESIRAWRLLDAEFTEESGHMTPTLKLKRAVVAADHAADIEALYTR